MPRFGRSRAGPRSSSLLEPIRANLHPRHRRRRLVRLPADEADITAAITDATATNYGFGLSLDIVRGATLTNAAGPEDEVVWQEGPDSELLDAQGRRYRYAVRRPC